MPHALIVDDDLSFQLAFAEVVQREGFTIATAPSLKEAREELARNPPHVLFLDLNLPDGSGMDLLEDLDGHPETVLITGQASVQTAVEALRRGVSDYLTKPVDFARVKMVLGNVARTRELKEEIGSLRGELRKLGRFGPLIGASPLMQKVYDLVGRVARTDATVLITGETGTGKEMVAQTIHLLSRRSRAAFLPLNCGAVSPTLIESELFGHERGSFTGADRVHKGFIERLAEHFLGLLNKQEGTSKEFTRAALERLRTHRWPGNVRELRNVVQRAFILAEEDVGIDALPLGVHEAAEGSSLQMKVGTSVAEAERRLILATLEHFEGDKKKAAEILKIS